MTLIPPQFFESLILRRRRLSSYCRPDRTSGNLWTKPTDINLPESKNKIQLLFSLKSRNKGTFFLTSAITSGPSQTKDPLRYAQLISQPIVTIKNAIANDNCGGISATLAVLPEA